MMQQTPGSSPGVALYNQREPAKKMKTIFSFVAACIVTLGLCFSWAQIDVTNDAYRMEQRK